MPEFVRGSTARRPRRARRSSTAAARRPCPASSTRTRTCPWDGFRENEFNRRLKGETYAGDRGGGRRHRRDRRGDAARLRGDARRERAQRGSTACSCTGRRSARRRRATASTSRTRRSSCARSSRARRAIRSASRRRRCPRHEVPPERRGSDALRAPLRRRVPRRDPPGARGAGRALRRRLLRGGRLLRRGVARDSRGGKGRSASSRASTRTS